MATLPEILENCARRRIANTQYPGLDAKRDTNRAIDLKALRCMTCAGKCFTALRPGVCGAYEPTEESSPTWGQYVALAKRYQESNLL